MNAMQVDFNVLKGDIDIAEVETMLSREYDEIWSRTISSRYVYPDRCYYSYAVYVYKEGTGQGREMRSWTPGRSSPWQPADKAGIQVRD